MQQPVLGTWSNFYAIKFSHNGQKIARNNSRSVDFFDASSGALIKTLPTTVDWAQFAFSNDDKSIFVTMRGATDEEYLVERYDLETLNIVGEPLVIVGDPYGALMDEKYERMVTYGPYKLPEETTTVTVWDFETKSMELFEIPLVVMRPHFFGKDGLIFASGRPFQMIFSEIVFYNMKTRKIIKSLPVPQLINETIHTGGQLVGISGYSEKESNYYVFDFSQLENAIAQLKKLSSKQFALIIYAVMKPASKVKLINLKNNKAFTQAFEGLPIQLQEIVGKSARIRVSSCPIM